VSIVILDSAGMIVENCAGSKIRLVGACKG
jgi:hypothetical protein